MYLYLMHSRQLLQHAVDDGHLQHWMPVCFNDEQQKDAYVVAGLRSPVEAVGGAIHRLSQGVKISHSHVRFTAGGLLHWGLTEATPTAHTPRLPGCVKQERLRRSNFVGIRLQSNLCNSMRPFLDFLQSQCFLNSSHLGRAADASSINFGRDVRFISGFAALFGDLVRLRAAGFERRGWPAARYRARPHPRLLVGDLLATRAVAVSVSIAL